MSAKTCPRDGKPMKEISYEGQVLDRCGFCGGTWMDAGELQAILASREVRFDAETRSGILEAESLPAFEIEGSGDRAAIGCPVCAGKMAREKLLPQYSLMVDRCRAGHGTWLDPGELERVQVLFESQ